MCVCVLACYLLVDLLCGLCVAEGHSRYVFQNGHLHSAVTPIQQCHQRAWVHRPIHNGWPDTYSIQAYANKEREKKQKDGKTEVRCTERKWQKDWIKILLCEVLGNNMLFFFYCCNAASSHSSTAEKKQTRKAALKTSFVSPLHDWTFRHTSLRFAFPSTSARLSVMKSNTEDVPLLLATEEVPVNLIPWCVYPGLMQLPWQLWQ